MKQIVFLYELGGEWVAETASGSRRTGGSAVAALRGLEAEQIDRYGAAPDYDPEECLRLTPQELEGALDRVTGRRGLAFGSLRRRLAGVYHPARPYGFTRQRLLVLESSGRDLEMPILPGGGSLGYFVMDDDELRPLNGGQRSLEDALRAEGRPAREWKPEDLAWLLSEACGRVGARRCEVVDAGSLRAIEEGSTGLDGYVMDVAEYTRHTALMVSPHWLATEADVVEFTTVSGWMHDLRQLEHWTVCVLQGWQLEVTRVVLSKKIFRATPSVRY